MASLLKDVKEALEKDISNPKVIIDELCREGKIAEGE
jgi:hypothetical protein